jgi:hypothetical protein
MKTLKIRFIELPAGNQTRYELQIKKWYGWKIQGYLIDLGYGGVYEFYTSKNKEELLNIVLGKEFNTTKNFIRIIEYPSLKRY